MKLDILILAAFVAASTCAADPASALLVVQNHTDVKDAAVLTSVGDQFASALGDELFEIVNPNDVIGENQNVGPWGEKMPTSSAVRLAESCGADFLLTAAITDISRRDIGAPPIAGNVVVTWSVAVKRVPSGRTVCSVTLPFEGQKQATQLLASNFQRIRDEALRESVKAAADAFLAKAKTRTFVPDKKVEHVSVAFVANLAGADVRIDGISCGTAGTDLKSPLKADVSKGVHNLEIVYPFMVPYKTVARFDVPSTFVVNLHETVEGRALRQGDQILAAALERILKGGATDDDAKLVKAKGYAKCLEASSFKIAGMPEHLTMVKGDTGAFGLGIIQEEGK